MKAILTSFGVLLLALHLAPTAVAAPFDGNPKVALHLGPHTSKSTVDCDHWTVPCSQFETEGMTRTSYDVYLVLAGGDSLGFAGVSCGLAYDGNVGVGVDLFSWIFCGDWEIPNSGPGGPWPASGGGTRMTWNTTTRCQTMRLESDGVHALVGSFYVYAYGEDAMFITENKNLVSGPELVVSDCQARITKLEIADAGAVRFSEAGNEDGYNPCTGAGTMPTGTPPPGPGTDPTPPPYPTGPRDAAMLLHIGEPGAPGTACASAPASPEEIVTSAPASEDGLPYYVYLLGTSQVPRNPDPEIAYGLTGIRFGIDYDAGDALKIFSWHSCSNTALVGSNWPQSGSGITLLWPNDCDQSELVLGGYFYLSAYAPATMSVMAFPGHGGAEYANCYMTTGTFTPLDEHKVGWVSMGGARKGLDADGCNPLLEPCNGPVAVEAATWGQLKTKFTSVN